MSPTIDIRNSVRTAIAAWIAGLAVAGAGHASEPPLDVILISLDTVRADFLTFDDADTAAHMAELARRGTIFRNAVSSTSWTLPAHVQMFTGTPPAMHGVESDFETIDPLTPVLPEILDRAGWFTAGAFTVRYLWGDFGFDRGFDDYRSAMNGSDLVDRDSHSAPRGEEARARAADAAAGANERITSPNVVAAARRALERTRPGEPLFLFLHLFDPHSDYLPPPPWDTRFDPDYEGGFDPRNFTFNKAVFDPDEEPGRRISDRDLEYVENLYRGEIAWTDQAIGEILALLELHGRLDQSLIIIVSDHGEEFFEHGRHYHRQSLYDESIRVPLLIVPPKSWRTGLLREVASQVGLSDLLPTILDFAGIDPPEQALGRSLRPAMYGESIPDRPELLSLYTPSDERRMMYHSQLIQGIRTREYKLLRLFEFPPSGPPAVYVRYYDLIADPEEQQPIGIEDARTLEAWETLEDELDVIRGRLASAPRTSDAERHTDVRESFVEELLALGYVESDSASPSEAPRPWGELAPMPRLDARSLFPNAGGGSAWAGWLPWAAGALILGALFGLRRLRAR